MQRLYPIPEFWRARIFSGWISKINETGLSVHQQVHYYQKMGELVETFLEMTVLPFDEAAAIQFEQLKTAGIRGKPMDLKIASIALCHNAIVLTQNRQDFERVPNLRVEDWLLDDPSDEPPYEQQGETE
jgi:tRNA(fMet)-specific endonuclease VapC